LESVLRSAPLDTALVQLVATRPFALLAIGDELEKLNAEGMLATLSCELKHRMACALFAEHACG